MKLKHIFENTPQQPKMTVQQVEAALEKFTIVKQTWRTSKNQIIIDKWGLIHINGALFSDENIARMPLQLELVHELFISGLETLEGLPRQILYYLTLNKFMGSDLTTFPQAKVFVGSKNSYGQIHLINCTNLKTLEGIDRFKSGGNPKIKVVIEGCDNLAFDPYAYTGKYIFQFEKTIPSQVPLVKAVALTNSDQINFDYLKDYKLADIINKYRGEEASMPSLALELARAGYRGHAGLT